MSAPVKSDNPNVVGIKHMAFAVKDAKKALEAYARFLHVPPTLNQNITEVFWRADYCRITPAVISNWKLDCGVIVPVTRTSLAFDEAGASYSRISTCYGVCAE